MLYLIISPCSLCYFVPTLLWIHKEPFINYSESSSFVVGSARRSVFNLCYYGIIRLRGPVVKYGEIYRSTCETIKREREREREREDVHHVHQTEER